MDIGSKDSILSNGFNKRKHSTPNTSSNTKVRKFAGISDSIATITPPDSVRFSNLLPSNKNIEPSFKSLSEGDVLSASFQQRNHLKEQSFLSDEKGHLSWSMVKKSNTLKDINCIEEVLQNSIINTTSDITQTRLINYHPGNKTPPADCRIKWNNPILGASQPDNITSSTSSKQVLSRTAFDKIYSSFRFNKEMLRNARVLGQADQKFIACILKTQDDQMLVLMDQHAAHERIRLEKLLCQIGYYNKTTGDLENCQKLLKNQICLLSPPKDVCFTDNEIDLLLHYTAEFRKAGISFTTTKSKMGLGSGQQYRVLFSSVPSIFVNVCGQQTKAKGSSVNGDLLKDYILEQSRLLKTYTSKCSISSSPTIFKVLASHACHGAIKFGDFLQMKTCVKMIQDLAMCQLPFQCAHGRPSIAPLLRFSTMIPFFKKFDRKKPNLKRLKLNVESL